MLSQVAPPNSWSSVQIITVEIFAVKSWKTTSGGIAGMTGGIVGLIFGIKNHTLTAELCTAYVGSILTGAGLIFARDNNVSSVDVGIQGTMTDADGDAVITPVGPRATEETKEKFRAIPCP